MAQVTRDILKSYFRTGMYPTEEQFATLIDSLRHYLDEIPMSKVSGLAAALNGKASTTLVNNKADLLNIADYEDVGDSLPTLNAVFVYTSGVETYLTHSRSVYLHTDQTDEDGHTFPEGVYHIFCTNHDTDMRPIAISSHMSVYDSSLNYVKSYDYDEGVSGNKPLQAFLDALGEWSDATTTMHGLMSAADKAKLDIAEAKASVQTTSLTTITPTLNSCYRVSGSVTNLVVTLNSGMGDYVGAVTIYFTAGSSTPISFAGTGTKMYQSGITFESGTDYEVNCLWIGDRWIVAVNTLVTTLGD